MTNITLSIEQEVYSEMKRHSEIKWSEFIRKAIKQRIQDLMQIEKSKNKEGILTMLASENILKKDWNTKEEDLAWNDL
jgi:metal-responsive CopG/Arc/MetJ family transcriptional regulator